MNTPESAGGTAESVRRRARALGFDICRITTAAPPASAERFLDALASGRHGAMDWLARTAGRRTDPQSVLPGVRSIVIVAISYASSPPPSRRASTVATGRVARYARHEDYHEVMAPGLRALAAHLDSLAGPGGRSLWYVDTGPVLERDLAQRAGLGFIGKHTNLISRELGNWFLLGEVLTTADLAADPPERNRCGSCTRCLAACPTAAFPAPFTLDARRCISYLTIEWKGPVPEEFRPLIGDRIFGCDDCLEVCPWNRFAREGALMRAHRRPDLDAPRLRDWLSLDEAAFRSRFRGTPLMRTKRRGLLRNVCIALGNVGGAGDLDPLREAAGDSEPLIAEHAAWAVRRIEERLGVTLPAGSPGGEPPTPEGD
ncbi:MAG: tRNA epoxyqueuosine(34) reductase QueG [Verrucomicrobiae bacterium]|nr:tRNA epoxyqueuosine(34) reductase QueG [Verrucomicrobiae bacterium]